jgi:hypothetical protein
MNFVLFHSGNNFPSHIIFCIQNIQKYNPGCKVSLITDKKIISNDVEVFNINDFDAVKLTENNFYKNTHVPDLFRNSLFRFFFINELMKKQNLQNVIHFDNDVLVYQNFTKFIDIFSLHNISITPHSKDEYVCGFMFIKDNIDIICNYFSDIVKMDHTTLAGIAGNKFMYNEMRLFSKLNETEKCFNLLPILPFGEFSNNFDKFDSLFDPSSYGQHIGGTPDNPTPSWVCQTNTHRAIDPYLSNKEVEVIFYNQEPFVKYKNEEYKLNNLHIHSKQLSKYV